MFGTPQTPELLFGQSVRTKNTNGLNLKDPLIKDYFSFTKRSLIFSDEKVNLNLVAKFICTP